MGLRMLGGSLAVVLASTSVAFAANQLDLSQIEDVEALSLSDLLEQPTFAASRYAQRPADSPSLVTSVDAETIAHFGARTVAEALRGVRGVYTSNDRNYSYLGFRGFSVPGDFNTRIALAVDNHRINDPIYGQATPGTELGLPMIAVERIEVLRGGAWSVYGQSALLGAIQVVTATGASRPGLRVSSQARSTFESYTDLADRPTVAPRGGDVSASYGAHERGLDVFAAGTYLYDPGLRAIYTPDLAIEGEPCSWHGQPHVCDGVVKNGDAEELAGGYLAVRGKHVSAHALASWRRKLTPTAAYATVIGDAIETYDRRLFADVEYSASQARADVSARASADYYSYSGRYPYDGPSYLGAEVMPGSRVNNTDAASAVWFAGELRGRYKIPQLGEHLTDVEVAGGAEVGMTFADQVNGDDLPDGFVSYIDRRDRSRTAALAAHVSGRAFAHLVGFAAVRGDYQPDAFSGVVINPQGGLVLDGGDVGRIRVSVARGFRPPNIYERIWDSSTLSGDGIRALAPERSETRELSVERYLGKRVRVQLIGYQQRITDLLALTTTDEGNAVFQNRDSVESHGVEAEVEGRWDDVRLRGNVVWQDSADQDGELPVNAPRTLGAFSLLAPIAGGRATAGVETCFVGERGTIGGGAVPAVFLTNVAITVRDVIERVDLGFGASNLFDQRTADPGSEEHRQAAIPQDPRTIWVRLALELDR